MYVYLPLNIFIYPLFTFIYLDTFIYFYIHIYSSWIYVYKLSYYYLM